MFSSSFCFGNKVPSDKVVKTMFQAIIQGLRESDVFSSVIASAPSALSKEKFFLSIDSSNSSKAVASESLPSRKLGRSRNQATSRKVLDAEIASFQEAAIPPLSPPGRDDDHFIEEAR